LPDLGDGGELAAFPPPIAPNDPKLTVRACTAVTSTLLVGLKLARECVLIIEQEVPMSECWLKPPLSPVG